MSTSPPQMSVAPTGPSQPPVAPPLANGSSDPALLQSRGDLFSSLYDGAPNMCVGPSPRPAQAPASAPPATGLASYQPVPDNFVGPLMPNQIRQSQYNDLQSHHFDQFNVVPDGFVGPLQQTQMTQSQYAQMQQGWLNIADGRGMAINGTPADQETFRNMLRNGMTDSPVFRQMITNIGNDADPKHRISANVGRNQPEVVGDSYGDNAIDLDDLEAWPAAAPAAHKNQFTRNEDIIHFLTERQYALGHPDPGGDKWKPFNDAHQHGLDMQNSYRDERGQSHVLSQTGTADAHGSFTSGNVSFADGTSEQWALNHGKITGITPP